MVRRDNDNRAASNQRRGRGPPARRQNRSRSGPSRPQHQYNAQPTTTEATTSADELRYSAPSIGRLVPTVQHGLINHTAEGYLNLIECCYDKMLASDGHISRLLPLSVFTHNMVQLYHCQLLRIASITAQHGWDEYISANDVFQMLGGDNIVMPIELYDWLQGLGKFYDKTGYAYVTNVPSIIVPKQSRIQDRVRVEGGDFGEPTAANHNCYEISIAPMVTRRLVEAQIANQIVGGRIVYQPLNAVLMPANLTPTANLLGYNPYAHPWHRDTVANYAQATNAWSTTDIGSRFGYNSVLCTLQSAAISSMMGKMLTSKGLPPVDKGSLAMNGTLIVEDGDDATVLRHTNGRINSLSQLDPVTVAGVAIKSYRRQRSENVPGTCFLRDGEVPAGWRNTINSSYDMVAPFQPSYGVPDLTLNGIRFRQDIPMGRSVLMMHELLRLTKKARQ